MEENKEKNVEHALQKRDIRELQKDLRQVSDDMKEGFRQIHARQDKTNGNVQQNSKWRWILIGSITILWSVVVPLIVYIWQTK